MDAHHIDGIWADMETEKGDLIDRSEAFSRWTVAAIMPADGNEKVEQVHGNVHVGASLVNHLANKIVDVLFPVSRPFFTVALTPETQLKLEQELGDDKAGVMQESLRDATAKLENVAMRHLKLTAYRPVAIMACKHLIVTGNVLLRRMPSGERVLYPVNRDGVRRDILGKEIEVVLSDKKMFSTFDEAVQERILAVHPQTKPADIVELLTHYKKDGKRWAINQEAEGVKVGDTLYQSAKDYDLLVLDWTLHPGEHYGRGLVEDHAATFHNIDVTNEAIVDLSAIIADIKFLVKPGSPLSHDLAALNAAPRGTYFPGNADDISIPEMRARGDLSTMIEVVARWENELKEAFLKSTVRDAERVTAQEIRMVANELESAFGGLYSQLAMDWQQKEADYAIAQVDLATEIGELGNMFEVVVTTGLESLSREGQIDNLRLAIGDLQMMEAVPEDVRGALNPLRFAKFVFTNRNVDLKAFLNTPEEMQANREQELQEAGRLEAQAGEQEVATHAGKAAVDQQQA
jgi:hypothetical protein